MSIRIFVSPPRLTGVLPTPSIRRRSLELEAGANITLTPTQTDGLITVAIASTGGSGTPAGSVVAETSFGASSAVGSSTDYARADHTHGTPAAPSTDVSTLLTAPSTIAADTCRYVAPNYTISTGDLTIVGDLVVGG